MKTAVFCMVSLALIYMSRASLFKPKSHGFYRFFAWEMMLLLFLLNFRYWFHDPFSFHQIVAWMLLFIAAFLALYGFYLLMKRGKHDAGRNDAPMMTFEKTAELVTTGLYRYIRHPLYSSLLFLTWGIFFKMPSGWAWLPAIAASVLLVLTVLREEVENIAYFGEPYRVYMKRSRRFVPFVF